MFILFLALTAVIAIALSMINSVDRQRSRSNYLSHFRKVFKDIQQIPSDEFSFRSDESRNYEHYSDHQVEALGEHLRYGDFTGRSEYRRARMILLVLLIGCIAAALYFGYQEAYDAGFAAAHA